MHQESHLGSIFRTDLGQLFTLTEQGWFLRLKHVRKKAAIILIVLSPSRTIVGSKESKTPRSSLRNVGLICYWKDRVRHISVRLANQRYVRLQKSAPMISRTSSDTISVWPCVLCYQSIPAPAAVTTHEPPNSPIPQWKHSLHGPSDNRWDVGMTLPHATLELD